LNRSFDYQVTENPGSDDLGCTSSPILEIETARVSIMLLGIDHRKKRVRRVTFNLRGMRRRREGKKTSRETNDYKAERPRWEWEDKLENSTSNTDGGQVSGVLNPNTLSDRTETFLV
jgi:hypothetical protein